MTMVPKMTCPRTCWWICLVMDSNVSATEDNLCKVVDAIKSIVVQCPLGVVLKFGADGASSGVVLIT
ncbi:hypothetical protein TNCV_629501 [Trichonephila clavipes]|nr:hypothetical protein TNCV_629501 [Trichonephila clavipes]